MVRVRDSGKVVPRFSCGLLRIVRGDLRLEEVWAPDLHRHIRTAVFICQDAQRLELLDVALMHLKGDRMVLSGFERVHDGLVLVDYAQTWVLSTPEGATPEPTMGPPFLR